MEFEFHQRPNGSRLEAVEKDIAAMRAANWPYQRIALWLESEKSLTISKEAIRQFCKIRQVPKGRTNLPSPKNSLPATQVPAQPGKKFSYDDTKPIEIRRSGH